jgi:hypothetical protein
MTTPAVAASIATPDGASLLNTAAYADGVFFRCITWSDFQSAEYQAAVYVENEDGQEILINRASLTTSGAGSSVNSSDSDDGGHVRVVAIGSRYFVAIYKQIGANSFRRWSFDTSNPDAGWTDQGTSAVGASSTRWFDISQLSRDGSGDMVMCSYESSVTTITVRRFSGPTWTVAWTATIGGVAQVTCLGIWGDATENAVLISYATGTTLFTSRMTAAGTGTASTTTLAAGSGLWTRVGICLSEYTGPYGVVCAEWVSAIASPTTFGLPYVYAFRVNLTTSAVHQGYSRTEHVTLQSRPWAWPGSENGYCYAVLGFISVNDPGDWDQNNYYVCHIDENRWGTSGLSGWRARIACNLTLGTADSRPGNVPGQSTGARGNASNHLPHPSYPPPFGPHQLAVTVPLIVWSRKVPVVDVTGAGTARSLNDIGVDASRVRVYRFVHADPNQTTLAGTEWGIVPDNSFAQPTPALPLQPAQMKDTLVLSSGTPQIYDGHKTVEIGFAWWPEIFTIIKSGTTTPHVPNCIYYYTAYYEWRDSHGRVHRSAPARPFMYSDTGSGAASLAVYVRPLSLTLKQHAMHDMTSGATSVDQGNVLIVVCRSTSQGASPTTIPSLFYRLDTVSIGGDPAIINDPALERLAFSDVVDDSTLIARELCPYQLINAQWTPLPNVMPPASGACAVWRNRLWLQPLEEPSKLWYSGELTAEPGGTQMEAPRFSPSRVYDIGADGPSAATAMAVMDDALLVFRGDRIHALNGDGCFDDGSGATLNHQRLSLGIGAMSHRTVAAYPGGVVFQSMLGIYSMSRSLTPEYVGSGVHRLVKIFGAARATTVLEDRHQVRFLFYTTDTTGTDYGARRVVAVWDYLLNQWSVHRPVVVDESYGASGAFTFTANRRGSAGTHFVGRSYGLIGEVTQSMWLEKSEDATTPYADQNAAGSAVSIVAQIKTGPLNIGGLLGFQRLWKYVVKLDWDADAANVPSLVGLTYYPASDGDHETIAESVSFNPPGMTSWTLGHKPGYQKVSSFKVFVSVTTQHILRFQSIAIEWGQKPGAGRLPDARFGA